MSDYESRGVSADKQKVLQALAGTSRSIFPGAFCQALPDVFSGSPEHCALVHADGVGTKSSLAYIWWRETGDASVFRGIAEDALVMNLDDLACVGATGPYVLTNLIGRNAKVVPEQVVHEVVRGYHDLIARLEPYGIEIHPCGGETADAGDVTRTIMVDAVLATRMARKDFVDCSRVHPGLAIVGLASYGQTPWEPGVNSGIGSNGLTLARHDVLSSRYRDLYPESFAPDIADVAYTGKFELSDPVPGSDMTVGAALLSPTRTYAPVVRTMLDRVRDAVVGIFHNSGGGVTKCLGFGAGVRYVKDSLLPMPPVFRFLKDDVGIPPRELARVFNLGQRLEVLCRPDAAEDVAAIAREMGVDAQVIGHTEELASGTELVVDVDGDTLTFTRGAAA